MRVVGKGVAAYYCFETENLGARQTRFGLEASNQRFRSTESNGQSASFYHMKTAKNV